MRRQSYPFLALAVAVVALSTAPAVSAAASPRQVHDPVPIERNQYFTGLINGHPPGQAIIDVICPSPIVSGETGEPAADQTVEVEPATSTSSTVDLGYTGSATTIDAALSASPSVLFASFTSYYVPKYIPTDIRVPCSGTGTVTFNPSSGAATSYPATLSVEFANIAGPGQ
jgi:hypothetical protein